MTTRSWTVRVVYGWVELPLPGVVLAGCFGSDHLFCILTRKARLCYIESAFMTPALVDDVR
jgi:hypothetical protein